MKLILVLFLFFAALLSAQDNCQFNYYNKKGGHYLFSTYFHSDLQTRMQDTCQSFINGKLYERRVFDNGHLIEETLNHIDGTLRTSYKLDKNPKDSIISRLVSYWETGKKNLEWIFYLNKENRRCSKEMTFHPNGNLHSVNCRAWIRLNEISEYEKKNYPEHTVDDEGYTYLAVPIDVEEKYHENGQLATRYYNKFIPSEFGANRSYEGPFTQFYNNGQLHIKGQYKDGRAEGKFINYHMSGEISEEKYFHYDSPVGTWKGWHPNGKIWYVEIYDSLAVNPFLASDSKYWNENGIMFKDYHVDRQGTGYEMVWYQDGKPMFRDDITNYQRYWGVRKDWFPDGKLWKYLNRNPKADTAFMEYFSDGMLKFLSINSLNGNVQEHKQKEWYQSGKLKIDYLSQTGDGKDLTVIHLYYPSGILENYSEYGDQTRKAIDYYQNGRKKSSASYYLDKLEGSFQTSDSSGRLLEDMNYKNGLRHGNCRSFDNSGKLIFERQYQDGCINPNFKTITEPKRRNLRGISPGLNDSIRATVIEMYQRELQITPSVRLITNQQIDSTSQQLLYLYDEWIKNKVRFPFPFSVKHTIPVIRFILPETEYRGLEKGDLSKFKTLKLKAVFDSLNWVFPTNWKLEGNNIVGSYSDNNLYSLNMIYEIFVHWYNLGQLQYDLGWSEIDYGWKGYMYSQPKLSINQQFRTKCVQAFSISGYVINSNYLVFYVYPDGSAEIYNRITDWKDIEEAAIMPELWKD